MYFDTTVIWWTFRINQCYKRCRLTFVTWRTNIAWLHNSYVTCNPFGANQTYCLDTKTPSDSKISYSCKKLFSAGNVWLFAGIPVHVTFICMPWPSYAQRKQTRKITDWSFNNLTCELITDKKNKVHIAHTSVLGIAQNLTLWIDQHVSFSLQ